MAQLKKLLNNKLDFSINLDELGFPKLRNLVVHYEDIKLESLGNNHFYLSIDNDVFNKLKAKSPLSDQKEEIPFKPILADLSKDSITLNKMYSFPLTHQLPVFNPQLDYSSYSLMNPNVTQNSKNQKNSNYTTNSHYLKDGSNS